MRQTGYLPRPPTSTLPPEILHAGVVSRKKLHIASFVKIGPGVSELWGSKIALFHWQGQWLIQQIVLPYKTWCGKLLVCYCVCVCH